ncbi:uncharacterized protein LOC113003306 [Solenopsis invicta]|uniref:uncharacterized protein LOC113003306 n=1 Tax=Solenopsis invicta TaxID=13686 RepID=UPI00193D4FB1|nr:uncharacterized protein LOC113003306 [Solenopsis invicta]
MGSKTAVFLRLSTQSCFSLREKMQSNIEHYYRIQQVLLTILGLWPYSDVLYRRIQKVFVTILLLFSIFLQVAKIATSASDLESLLQLLSYAIPCLIVTVKYASFSIKSEDFKKIIEQIHHDWNSLKCKEELKILRQRLNIARLMTMSLGGLFYIGVCLTLITQILPKFLDIVMPLNESRPLKLLGLATLFFDQDKYFFPILIHMTVALFVEASTIIATEGITAICLQHACSLFKITSFRIKHAFDCKTQISDLKKHKIYYTNIVNAIIIHNKAVEFFDYFNSCIEVSYFLLLLLGVVSLSLNLLRILANDSADIFYDICQLPWYAASIPLQKLLQFIMQRSLKHCKFSIFIFIGSLELFTTTQDLIERVRINWNELNNARELEIIKKYSAFGKLITLVSTWVINLSVFGVIIMTVLVNYVLKVPTSANESRQREFPAEIECFVDHQKYFAPLLVYMFFVVWSSLTVLAASETLFMSYTQHACGLFEIVNCRIEQSLNRGTPQNLTSVAEKNSIICQGIISAIDIHKKAIEFVEMLKDNFKWVFFTALPLTVLSLSINLYRLSRQVTSDEHHETITTLLFATGQFGYLFFCNYLGQEVIDHSGDIFHKTYNIQWYMAPLKAQKLLLLVMQRSMQYCTITIGGLFIPSLEGFASLSSMSLSYFMVIYSIQ